VAELRSAHIVQIIDYGIDGNTPFIAMELLEGESLAARLDRLGKLPADDTARILLQVARALTRAHEKGIVHRDLKPDNIFIVREGDEEIAKVLDFGVAKKLDTLSLNSGVTTTRTGALLGTPYYMSPEHALGQTSLDHRTDIWALGVIAYECLTGRRPFERDSFGALLMSICHEPLPTPSKVASVPPGFDAWFARAASRDLAARFQTAAEAAAELCVISCVVLEHPAQVVDSALAVSPLAVNAGGPSELLETASPASMTIPGLPKKRPLLFFAFLVLPALGLAVALVYMAWQRWHLLPPLVTASAVPELTAVQGGPALSQTTATSAPHASVLPSATVSPTALAASVPSPKQAPKISTESPVKNGITRSGSNDANPVSSSKDKETDRVRSNEGRATTGQDTENAAGF
jgi:serine/threonine protein kinase